MISERKQGVLLFTMQGRKILPVWINDKERIIRGGQKIMSGTKVIYGYKDLDHAIMCTVKDLIFRGMDILIVADCEGGTITAPVEMFQWMEA